MERDRAQELMQAIPEWALRGDEIRRRFKFDDFQAAMAFVNRVADIAEEEDHHPDIAVSYDKVDLTLTTHAIDGLSENDFIVAAKIDRFLQPEDERAQAATSAT